MSRGNVRFGGLARAAAPARCSGASRRAPAAGCGRTWRGGRCAPWAGGRRRHRRVSVRRRGRRRRRAVDGRRERHVGGHGDAAVPETAGGARARARGAAAVEHHGARQAQASAQRLTCGSQCQFRTVLERFDLFLILLKKWFA